MRPGLSPQRADGMTAPAAGATSWQTATISIDEEGARWPRRTASAYLATGSRC